MNEPLKIVVTLPYLFTVRDFLFTPVWNEMAKRKKEARFYLLSNDKRTTRLVTERGTANISALTHPAEKKPASPLKSFFAGNLPRRLWALGFQALDSKHLYNSLVYRFSAINSLAHYKIRRNKSRAERKRQQVFLIYREGEKAGFPCPGSTALFRLLYYLRHSSFNTANPDDVSLLGNISPDLFVMGRLQFPTTAYWTQALKRLGIPSIGIVSSWDHPTIQGPLTPGMSGYIVASRHMADELCGLHGIDPAKICQTGKVQMDRYKDPAVFYHRQEFLAKLGIPHDNRLVTFGTNTTGLKEHEVSIAHHLANNFIRGRYGAATMLLRTHPQDANAKRDFLSLNKPPQVICYSAASFGDRPEDNLAAGEEDQVFLANLMKHSDIVIQSRGSMALDAIAFDTPVISLAFDGDLVRQPNDSFLLEYEYEHYKPLVSARGTWMAGSYAELDKAIQSYLADPSIHKEGRTLIREMHIDPLDGHASRRLVDYMVTMARKAREGTLPPGDWEHTGLGDVKWAEKQVCKVADYVQK